jgi:hypothetical protein
MIVDIINQDLIIPNVEKVAKLCADFKSGVETIFVSKDNKQEYIEIDDSVRQGDYKYTYSDNSATAVKSEQADLVVSAVEKFAQVIPLNIQEIFLWYFEQKGVDNPERFLMGENEINQKSPLLAGEGQGEVSAVNNNFITPPQPSPSDEGVFASLLQALNDGNSMNPENQLSNNLPPNLPPQSNTDVILGLINLILQVSQRKVKNTSELEELINSMEQLLEEK